MKDMDKAVDRILKAIQAKEKISIYGDYDADGATSTALLVKFFGMLNVAVNYYIPNRVTDGYGLNNNSLRSLKDGGTRLIITVDNGINADEQIDYANSLGLDVIITDHHEPKAKLPKAFAVINPKRSDCNFPFKDLAGVGVAFNLAIALRQRLRDFGYFVGREEPRLRDLLDIVAIGTVADVVPLVDENRIFVKYGVSELKRSTNKGINALKIISGLESHQIDSTTIAFRLAPRINAGGRVDDQNLGTKLLTCMDPIEASEFAEKLNAANLKRQSIESVILKETNEILKTDSQYDDYKGLVLAKEGWHIGVIGIVAARISEAHIKPTALISVENGIGRGSVRSVGSYNIIEALSACGDLLVKFGGHKSAAGLVINKENIPAFEKRFNEVVKATLTEEDRVETVMVDSELESEHICEALVAELEKLEPFGEGNEEPTFSIKDLKVSDSRIVAEKHLKLKFSSNMIVLDAIGFGMAANHDVSREDVLDVAFIPKRDNYRGNGAVQLKLRALKNK